MPSTISDYISALKKTHHDDLPDYDRGRLHGRVDAQLAYFAVSMPFMLFGVYKQRKR